MRQTTTYSILLSVLLGVVTLSAPKFSYAQADRSLREQPAVRHRTLYRSTRLEIAPSIATTLDEAYINDRMVGLNLVYHLNDSFNLGLYGAFSLLPSKTDLNKKVDVVLRREDQNRLRQIGYSHTQAIGGFEIGYVPIFGKFSLFGSGAIHYDIHALAGFSFVQRAGTPAVSGGSVDPILEGLQPSPVAGVGSRFFLSESVALNLQFRDYIYPSAPVSAGDASTEVSQNFLFTFGLSLFAGDAKRSR